MGAASRYVNIEIRGVVYPTAQAAAVRLGVGAQAVRRAARAGTLHRVGLGKRGKEPMRVRIRGRTFEDAHEAAAALGVTPDAVWAAIWKGDPDRVRRKRRTGGATAMPFEVGGLVFASRAEASRQLGFHPSYVSLALRRGSSAMWQRILGAAMRLKAEREGGKPRAPDRPAKTRPARRPVEIGGLAFASLAEAGRQLGGFSSADVRDAVDGRSQKALRALELVAAELAAERRGSV